jgi:RIO kinase 1
VTRDEEHDQFDRKIEAMGVRIKDADTVKVRDDVFDEVTLMALYKLVQKKLISVIGGPISTGKEANVFYGEHDGRGLAIKIYRIQTANFKAMTEYMAGDRRFSSVRGRARASSLPGRRRSSATWPGRTTWGSRSPSRWSSTGTSS